MDVSDETNDGEAEVRFGAGQPFSLGVEEELFAVDPVTGHQANSAEAVIERLGDLSGSIAQELHACQLELITDVHRTVGEAIGSLASMRRSVGEIGAGLLGSGTHPSGVEGDAEITDKERYERIRFLLGDADRDAGRGPARSCRHAGRADRDRSVQRAA